MAKQKVHAWQDKMRKAGKSSLTVFMDVDLITKIKTRAKSKGRSVAAYLERVLKGLYAQQDAMRK